ncbi:MAG: hypothetical protein OXF20_09025 [Gammaproteobacteria bacterium]|nr:hypothetical protein [Gammaproteobacteria bacterium]
MKSSTGRWVSGEDFFNREADLGNLKRQILGRNHVLLSGQRRMEKTSIVRELGRQLEEDGWTFLFVDIEGANCPEDVVANIAQAAYPVRPVAKRIISTMGHWFKDNVEEIGALDFGVRIRAGLDSGNWKRHGEQLFRDCAVQKEPALLAIDELPIFLTRMLSNDGNPNRVEVFLSWMRNVVQSLGEDGPVLMVSGSVGLEPLVRRLGIPDRINHFYPYRLGPWDRATSIKCFESLAENNKLSMENGVAEAVYDALGIGIPHHVQSFFARLRDFLAREEKDRATLQDVDKVYRMELLGPSGQNDLVHYETRLRETFDDQGHTIAMKILAETAIQKKLTPAAIRNLERSYRQIMENAGQLISEVMDILEHDGYLVPSDNVYCFASRLLQDWWEGRFRNHHSPLDLSGDVSASMNVKDE